MAEKKINITVLIAPLDWGLGHATRCIPIVKILLQKKCRVLIAADGPHKILLQQAFPELEFLPLKGYNIKYAAKSLLFNLAKQLPGFLKTMQYEHAWLAKTIDSYGVDLVISDNRYGLWSKKIPCILITHQLQLQMPLFLKFAEKILHQKLYSFVNKFSICWVPDNADSIKSLSGKLGHPVKMPAVPVHYIGVLSRFEKNIHQHKKYTLTVCLSGPEPQRTLFETILLTQLNKVQGRVLFIRGKPESDEILPQQENVEFVNHLPAAQMQQALEASDFILSRCGYSTLMDMQVLGCKCIYVPTPGQTEQEYLGKRLKETRQAVVFKQAGFDVEHALATAQQFDYQIKPSSKNEQLEKEIDIALKMIQND